MRRDRRSIRSRRSEAPLEASASAAREKRNNSTATGRILSNPGQGDSHDDNQISKRSRKSEARRRGVGRGPGSDGRYARQGAGRGGGRHRAAASAAGRGQRAGDE